MSSVSGKNMKGFYRQRKTTATKKSSKKSETQSSTFVSQGGNPDLEDERKENEVILRQFDMNTSYGPCVGMTRLVRWERAKKFGMNPPPEVETLLKSGKVQTESLWDGRI